MKKLLLLAILPAWVTLSFAQPTKEQRIADSVLGWYTKLPSGEDMKPYRFRGHTFTVVQKQKMNEVIQWMYKSYIPVGGLGTYRRTIYGDEKAYPPHQYGVGFRVWNVSYMKEFLDAKGHFEPVSEEYTRFDVNANVIPGSYPVYFINNPGLYLFTWQPDGYSQTNEYKERLKNADLKIHPNVYKYLTRINESHTVFLVPGNKLPIVAVTIGEYLQLAEEAFDREIQKQKEKFEGQWQNQKSRDDAMKYYKEKSDSRFRNTVKQLREKYKNSLQEPAVIRHMQPTVYNFDGDTDPFKIDDAAKRLDQYYPVYKIESAVMEKCKSDQPQWMAISFPYKTKEDGNQLYEMYRAITENFNYDYAYDYFFNPEKVKGIPYKPANEEQLNARLDGYRKKSYGQRSAVATQPGLPSNVLFMDDFLNNAEGSKPAGWYFSTYGKHATVTAIKNKPGKWVQLGYNNAFSSTGMKKPLPENFTMEYDLATDEFSTPTGGAAELYLSTYSLNQNGMENKTGKGTSVSVRVTSGNEAGNNNNNYRGAAKIEMHSWPGVNVENNSEGLYYTYNLSEFTNNKRQIHVKLQIKNGILKLFINEKHVAESTGFKMLYGKPCTSCALPANTKFNTIYWKNTTNNAEKVEVYISNIKLTKE